MSHRVPFLHVTRSYLRGMLLGIGALRLPEERRSRRFFPSLLARVKAGAEVVIERDAEPVAALRSAAVYSNPGILSGQPVFWGTRVTFQTLLDHLEDDGGKKGFEEFLSGFPIVTREQALALAENNKPSFAQMKLLLDEMLDQRLSGHFAAAGHQCTTVKAAGLTGLSAFQTATSWPQPGTRAQGQGRRDF